MKHYLMPLNIPNQQVVPKHQPATPDPCNEPVWVQLAALPSFYSHDQAMLLCRHSEDEWVAWVPEHGEVILHRSEFFFDSEWN